MKKVVLATLILSAIAVALTGATFLNVDDSMTGWKPVCVLPACNPGGSGTPTATSQTTGNASPSLDGSSMMVSVTGPSYTNALWTHIAERDDARKTFSLSGWVRPSSNASAAGSYEFDLFQFSSSTGIEYMWGSQCNQVNKLWQIWNQQSGSWINTAVPCNLPANQWNYIRWDVHRVQGQTSMYYDRLTVNNTVYAINTKYPAGPLSAGWSSANGFQVQIDIGQVNQNTQVNEFLDEFNFSVI